jgi:acetyl-CoA C-acetyltransferase/acetyl-CoA acyltransferase
VSRSERLAIVGGVRTPFLKAGTGFRRVGAADVARTVLSELLARVPVDPATVDEVILGCAGQPHDAQNVARVAALRAGFPAHVPAVTVHRNCASGFEALTQALVRVRAGAGELFVVGGVETMSRAPLLFREDATAWFASLVRAKSVGGKVAALAHWRPRFLAPRVALLDALTDPVCGLSMGETAEVLAREWAVSREAQDAFALESHRRAKRARDEGRLAAEIAPVVRLDDDARGEPGDVVAHDNGVRDELTLEQLARLKPYFDRRFGTVTVGNSCQVSDGAAAFVVASESKLAQLRLAPLGWLVDFAYVGLDPRRMGLGPVHATAKLLATTRLELGDFDVVELNEAFAAQVLGCLAASRSDDFARRELGRERALGEFDPARLNGNGGAIALGHPVAATGGRLVLTALHELQRRGGRRALATLCVGGGQGGALALEAP